MSDDTPPHGIPRPDILMADLEEVDGIEFCTRHRGIMTEGTDYIGEFGLGCEYPENKDPGDCIPTALYIRKRGDR